MITCLKLSHLQATERVEDEVFVNDKFKSQIARLENEVETERVRVLTLANLCSPIMNLAACCDEHNMDECAFYDPVLIDLGQNVPTHNWGGNFFYRDGRENLCILLFLLWLFLVFLTACCGRFFFSL